MYKPSNLNKAWTYGTVQSYIVIIILLLKKKKKKKKRNHHENDSSAKGNVATIQLW